MASGDVFSFEKARDLGLVNEVFGAETFRDDVANKVRSFVAPQAASQAIGLIKRSVTSGLEMSFEAGLSLERELQQRLFESTDSKEGLQAYVEKRAPHFRGR